VRAVDTLSRVNQHSTAPTTLVEQPEGARQSQSNQAFLRDSIKKMMPQLERPAPPSWQKCTQISTHGKRNDTCAKKVTRAGIVQGFRMAPLAVESHLRFQPNLRCE
jgi:hypothetical protein